MSHSKESVELSVEYLHETDRAVLITDGDSETWIPISQIRNFYHHVYEKGEAIEITISEWFAKQADLI